MRYISLFSGIEAASVAWRELGWTPVAFSEIEPFPCAVLAHHYPEVPNLGDITKVNWRSLRGKADVIIGGSPCQSFSIAGNREGLAGESGLMFEYIRAVREVRPRWFIWENVPGAFSVEHGAAFGQLLSEMDKLGYGLAWRVLDAQFFGVAQRRRRVFLVGSLGTMRCADVLFEPDCMRGDPPSSREKRKSLASASGNGAQDGCGECLTPWDVQSKRVISPDGMSPTLQSGSREGGNIQPIVMTTANSGANGSNVSDYRYVMTQYGDIAGSLTARHDSSPCPDRGQNVICIQDGQANAGISDDVSTTLNSSHEQPIVCMADDNAHSAVDEDMCGALKVGGANPMIAYSRTERKSRDRSAQGTIRESGASS